jgi:P27 family predicted phage terminase small subunit
MPVGRPPKPIERKRLTGNPGNRPLPDAQTVTVIQGLRDADMPAELGEGGQRVWRVVIGETGWVGRSDQLALWALAELEDDLQAMRAQVAIEGLTIVDEQGKLYQHPLLRVIGHRIVERTKLLSVMGLTPTDRSRLGLAEVKARSKLEELRERRQGAGA